MKDPALLEDLVDILTVAFDAISDPDKLVSDEYPSTQVWALVKKQGAKGHAAGRPKTLEGYASARSADKQQVADMNVMILREELESFQEDLQTAYRRFKTLCAGAGGNQKKIFDEFIEEYTGAAAGENDEYYDKNLLEIIGSQLPVQSAVLELTFRDVRAMPSDMFTLWIREIKTSADRAKAILDKKDLWISPNTTDPNVMDDDRFAFVPVVDLP